MKSNLKWYDGGRLGIRSRFGASLAVAAAPAMDATAEA
jgi:hypothetical protein